MSALAPPLGNKRTPARINLGDDAFRLEGSRFPFRVAEPRRRLRRVRALSFSISSSTGSMLRTRAVRVMKR
jgi:hypothetical protein